MKAKNAVGLLWHKLSQYFTGNNCRLGLFPNANLSTFAVSYSPVKDFRKYYDDKFNPTSESSLMKYLFGI